MSAQSGVTNRSSRPKVSLGRVALVGLLAVAAAVGANLLLRAALFSWMDLPADFPPFQISTIALFTAVGTLLGLVVYAILARVSWKPAQAFRVIAVIALLLSFIPDVIFMVNPGAYPFPGGSTTYFALLTLFHIVAALVFVGILTTFADPRRIKK